MLPGRLNSIRPIRLLSTSAVKLGNGGFYRLKRVGLNGADLQSEALSDGFGGSDKVDLGDLKRVKNGVLHSVDVRRRSQFGLNDKIGPDSNTGKYSNGFSTKSIVSGKQYRDTVNGVCSFKGLFNRSTITNIDHRVLSLRYLSLSRRLARDRQTTDGSNAANSNIERRNEGINKENVKFDNSSNTSSDSSQPRSLGSISSSHSNNSISPPHSLNSISPPATKSFNSIQPPNHPNSLPPPKVTKEQLLAKANNFLSRFKIRFKWLLKKSNRPFNTDDYSAMVSWIMMGNVILFILGTTTFISLVLFTANTIFAQEFVARKLGEFITSSSKLNVTFENAIVPDWSDGKICFKKCFVSRRPRSIKRFIKGSQAEAYAESLSHNDDDFDDGNYTQFDLTIEQVIISLSFKKWLNGTGIIETMQIVGMRGVVDRTHVHWDLDDDATNYKNIYQPGDFEIDEFSMQDILFKLKQPNNFRNFDVAIYNCELPVLRKHWLFYDLLNANVVSGAYDNSLFTVHRKQRFNDFEDDAEISNWKRVTRLRIDSLNIDHLNNGLEGPFGWITSGKVDMIGDIMVPPENDNFNVTELVNAIAQSIKKEATRYRNPDVKETKPDHRIRLTSSEDIEISKYFVLDLTLRLNNVKAKIPFKSPELSYVNYALIRPIVAYINSKNNSFIEIKNKIIKNIDDFSGSWTVYDSLLMDDISEEVYDNFVDYVADDEAKLVRMKKVAFWSLQLFIQLIALGLGTIA